MLRSAVKAVDHEMTAIRNLGKVKSRERIAVLAALNLAYALEQQPETSRISSEPGGEVDIGSLVARIDKALGEHGQLL
jgi:cell division protein ZapA